MKKRGFCECGSDKFITLSSYALWNLEPDAEPYEDGVEEELTPEDKKLVDSLELYVNINICRKCKKIFYSIEE